MTARLSGTNHVALTVTDLERSSAWYCDLFGLAPYSSVVSFRDPDNIALELNRANIDFWADLRLLP